MMNWALQQKWLSNLLKFSKQDPIDFKNRKSGKPLSVFETTKSKKYDQLQFIAYFRPSFFVFGKDSVEQKESKNEVPDKEEEEEEEEEKRHEMADIENGNSTMNSLDFKRHWNPSWRRSNVKAAKMVEKLMKDGEQGLIVVLKDTCKLKSTTNGNKNSFLTLINSDKVIKQRVEEYSVYLLKSKLVILDANVYIDGNVYAINCEMQCQKNVKISTQLFVTSKTIVDQKLQLSIAPIQWNTMVYHDIPIQLQYLQDKAKNASQKRQFDDAICHLQKALQISIDHFGSTHPYVSDIYLHFGFIYHKKGDFDKAIEYSNLALQIQLAVFEGNHADIGLSYNNLGVSYLKKKWYNESFECSKKALQVRLNVFGTKNTDVAMSYNNLGGICYKKQEYDRALSYYEKALKIRLDIFGRNHNEVALSYSNLGRFYYQREQYAKAIRCCEKSLKIRLSLFGTKNADVALSYKNLGSTIECHEHALKIRLDIFGIIHTEVANSYNHLGGIYYQKQQYDKAKGCYEKVVEIRRHLFGNKSQLVGYAIWGLAKMLELTGDIQTACQYYEETWKIYSVVLGQFNRETLAVKTKVKMLTR
ncbi:hypothetical protein RFI_15535 [Reticulomyxa filosa]|uniref:Uncharacterized protein n=1 Tax=Reticulomyxa filosa TaxID=46433 RepID=X6N7D5_RETFI|nr:hypothetical protein RFI_15535 [Reticulomyxa filosa]|eukprot:ETO21669.1 hypothetical protein RFI_15535 [Reticulomyxa filosa]